MSPIQVNFDLPKKLLVFRQPVIVKESCNIRLFELFAARRLHTGDVENFTVHDVGNQVIDKTSVAKFV